MIIIIDGPSGSGKTTLCHKINKFKHINAYDTDEIYSKSFFEVYKNNKKENKKFWKHMDRIYFKKIVNIYKTIHLSNRILIFIGSQKLPNIVYKNTSLWYCIKDINYKERINRDFKKIFSNKQKINNILKSDSKNSMTIINHGLMINTSLPDEYKFNNDIKEYYNNKKKQNIWIFINRNDLLKVIKKNTRM